MPSSRQANFSGGEIAPALVGRSDIEKYDISLETCRDAYPTPWGEVVNRPGTLYKGAVSNHAKTVRLVPFIYSDSDTYVLEFGDAYVRAWKSGVLLAAVVTGSIPYSEASLPYLKFAQVGDVLWLVHKDYPPATLTRVSDLAWTYAAVSFAPTAAYFKDGTPGIYASGTPDVDHPAREWKWKITAYVQDTTTGREYETNPYTVAHTLTAGPAFAAIDPWATYPVYPDMPVTLKWSEIKDATNYRPTGYSTYRILSWRVYRGRGRLYGFVGETGTENSEYEFVDTAIEPDYSIQPPEGRNPFEVYNSSASLVRTEDPCAISFFEQRLLFGGTTERPGWVFASALNSYTSFDKHLVVLEDDAVEFELASLRREEVRSMAGDDKNFVFTSGGVWRVSGVGGPLTAYSIQATKQTHRGATWLSPLEIQDALIYVQNKGVAVNLLDFEQERDKYSVTDVTMLASHFFQTKTITDWCYADVPHNVVWAVRSDGKLLSFTFSRALGVGAWALHETDGVVEAVCSVPEGTEDAVYLCVRRTINGSTKRYIERLASRIVSAVADAMFLDCAASYPATSGVSYNATTGVFSGLTHLAGRTVGALIDGAVYTNLTVSVGGALTLPSPVSVTVAHIGIAYTSRLGQLPITSRREDISGRKRRATQAAIDYSSSGPFWVGQSFDAMHEWENRQASDDYGVVALQTGQVSLSVDGDWSSGGRICIEMRDPLPLSITGINREFTIGGT